MAAIVTQSGQVIKRLIKLGAIKLSRACGGPKLGKHHGGTRFHPQKG